MSERGDRGKSTEKAVREVLEKMNDSRMDFAFHRLPDTRSAGSYLAKGPCDFFIVCKGETLLLEVKHSKHASRIGKDKVSQHPMLMKFHKAGASAFVLIEHENLGWRFIDVSLLPFGVASWNVEGYPIYLSAEHALTNYFGGSNA